MLPPNQTPLNSSQIRVAIELMRPNWKRIKIYRVIYRSDMEVFLKTVCNIDDCPADNRSCGGSPWDCIFYDAMVAVKRKVVEVMCDKGRDALYRKCIER